MHKYKSLDLMDVKYLDQSHIRSIEIALTQECNFSCPYCGAYETKSSSVSFEQILVAVDSITTLERVILSGGEVTLNLNECFKIAQYCKNRGIELQINTNGSLLDREKIEKLTNLGLSTIHISLNHTDPKSFAEYHNVPRDTFDKIIKNISYCVETVPTCVVESILCSDFSSNIVGVNKLLTQIGVKKHEIQYGIENNRWANHLDKDKILNILMQLFREKSQDMVFYMTCFQLSDYTYNLFKDYIERRDVFFTHCIEGHYQFHLHSNGDLIACDLGFPYRWGNISEGLNLNALDFTSEEIIHFQKNHNCRKLCVLA